MRMTHKQKVKLARQHMSRAEIIQGTPIFETKWWESRKLKRARLAIKRNLRYEKVI